MATEISEKLMLSAAKILEETLAKIPPEKMKDITAIELTFSDVGIISELFAPTVSIRFKGWWPF